MAHILSRFPALLRKISLAEKSALIALACVATAFVAFGNLAAEMMEGETVSFDRRILLAFRNPLDLSDPLGPRWLEEMMRDFTALGSMAVLFTVTLLVAGFLLLTNQLRSAMVVLLSIASGTLVSTALKLIFDRPRPDLVAHGTTVYTQSFPSGHAMLSAIVFLTLGVLLARTEANVRVKIYLLAVAALLTVIVGISRVYLGVHWPTDVLAGWAFGTGWALMCWLMMLWLQARGEVEQETA